VRGVGAFLVVFLLNGCALLPARKPLDAESLIGFWKSSDLATYECSFEVVVENGEPHVGELITFRARRKGELGAAEIALDSLLALSRAFDFKPDAEARLTQKWSAKERCLTVQQAIDGGSEKPEKEFKIAFRSKNHAVCESDGKRTSVRKAEEKESQRPPRSFE
jgi:hypothetical protein